MELAIPHLRQFRQQVNIRCSFPRKPALTNDSHINSIESYANELVVEINTDRDRRFDHQAFFNSRSFDLVFLDLFFDFFLDLFLFSCFSDYFLDCFFNYLFGRFCVEQSQCECKT